VTHWEGDGKFEEGRALLGGTTCLKREQGGGKKGMKNIEKNSSKIINIFSGSMPEQSYQVRMGANFGSRKRVTERGQNRSNRAQKGTGRSEIYQSFWRKDSEAGEALERSFVGKRT